MSEIPKFTPNERPKRPSRWIEFWREGHHQALTDLKTRWRSGLLRFLAAIWLSGLCLSIILLSQLSTTIKSSSVSINSFFACQPNGNFNVYPDQFHFWSGSGFFEITLGFGTLSFTEAKAIDVVWDIIVARGGQALLALVSWHVFTNYVTTSMEVAPVTFSTYRSIFVRNESLLFTIPRLLRDFSRRRGLRSRIAMIFIISTLVFILVFPSLASAMTGYSANVRSYIREAAESNTTMPTIPTDSNYITFRNFQRVLYTIHDGQRVGLNKDYIIPYGKLNRMELIDPVILSNSYLDYKLSRCDPRMPSQDRCDQQLAVAKYVAEHGFNSQSNKASTLFGSTIEAPSLNISAYYLPADELGANWKDPRTGQQPFQDQSRSVWSYGNTLYSMDQLKSLGACQPVENYKWGFSFIQLNIIIILCTIWTFGILIMHTQAHLTMKQRGRCDVAGDYKAVLELANAINLHFQEAADASTEEILSLSESEIRRCLIKHPNSGLISYTTWLLNDDEGVLKRWLRKEKWWIFIILLTYGTFSTLCVLMPNSMPWVVAGLLTALILSTCIGTSEKSRWILLLWGILILSVIPLGVSVPLVLMQTPVINYVDV